MTPTPPDNGSVESQKILCNFSIFVDIDHPNTLVSTAFPILHCIRPEWDITDIEYEFFTGGLTNKILCFWNRDVLDKEDRILLRIYDKSSELIIDRKIEYASMLLLHSHGLSVPLYCSFENGNAYGFAPGDVLDYDMVRDAKISRLIANKMAEFHSIKIEKHEAVFGILENRPKVYSGLEKFAASVSPNFENLNDQARFDNEFISITDIYKEIAFLEDHLTKLQSPIVFCHNDLLLKNIIYNRAKESIAFIDFEYAGFNYQSFDIANHFSEFAGTDDVDFSKYPDDTFQKQWLTEYLQEFHKINNLPYPKSVDVEKLKHQVDHSVMAAHFFWTVWSIVQAQNSKIDFDYVEYAILRLKEYFRLKEICVA